MQLMHVSRALVCTSGIGPAALARDLQISMGEVDTWITAFGAAFPTLVRKVSALRRGGRVGSGDRGREFRSISGRLVKDGR